MRILVIGAAGMLGGQLVERLVRDGYLEWTRFFGHSWACAASRCPCCC